MFLRESICNTQGMNVARWIRLTALAMVTVFTVAAADPLSAHAYVQDSAADAIAAQLADQRALALEEQYQVITLNNSRLVGLNKMEADILGYKPGTKNPRDIARQLMNSRYGWGATQFTCYDNIIMRESLWDPLADNPNSSAYGIPQALPGNRMAQFGADWRTNPVTQITWGLWYVKTRYGTPCTAWDFKKAHGWY